MDKVINNNTVDDMATNEARKKIEEIKSRNNIKKGVGAKSKVEREYLAANSYTYKLPEKRREVDDQLTPLVLTYGRVSYIKEDDNSATFERQTNSCEGLIKSDGLSHLDVIYFEDESISAFHTKQRASMDAMIKFVDEYTDSNPIYIYVEHIDRWVRNKQIADSIFAILKRQNVKLRIVHLPNIDLAKDDMANNIILDIMVQMAEGYSKSISDKATGGQKVRAEKGIWRNSLAPYGMKIGKRVIDGAERSILEPGDNADTVREIFKRINLGDSINDVVRWLNNSNIKPAGIADIWRDSTITAMLLNPHYAGFTRYNSKRKFNKYQIEEQIIKDSNGDFLISHEGIIEPKVFWTTIAILQSRQRPKSKKHNTHILSGLLLCADCGAKLYGTKGNGSNADAYRCPDRVRNKKLKPNSISAKGLEELIKGMAIKIIDKPELLSNLSYKSTVDLEEIEAEKNLILQDIAEYQEMIATETKPKLLEALQSALANTTFELEKFNTNVEINKKFATKALASVEDFIDCWDNLNKTAVIIALKSFIDHIEVEPLANRQKLNNVLLKKKGWLFDYTRVTIVWANGERYNIADEIEKKNVLVS